jgi:hypothetical protein
VYRSLKIICKWRVVAEEEKETKKEEGEEWKQGRGKEDKRGLYTYYSV